MFITAGYLEAVLNHSTWEEAVGKLVLTPIGMTATVFSSKEAQRNPDCAQPYRKNRRTEEVKRIPFAEWGDVGAAGGINSNLDDYDSLSPLPFGQGQIGRKTAIVREQLRPNADTTNGDPR